MKKNRNCRNCNNMRKLRKDGCVCLCRRWIIKNGIVSHSLHILPYQENSCVFWTPFRAEKVFHQAYHSDGIGKIINKI